MELAKYSWWGDKEPPPEHLKTKKQLGELGLSPLKPSGVIPTRKYDVLLYDPQSRMLPTQKKTRSQAIGNPCSQPPQSPNRNRSQMGSIEVIERNQYRQRFGIYNLFFSYPN